MSFVYLPTCRACSVAETKEQEHRSLGEASFSVQPRLHTCSQAPPFGPTPGHRTPQTDGLARRGLRPQLRRPRLGACCQARRHGPSQAETKPASGWQGGQHLPAPAPPAAALPSPGAGGAPAGEPQRGSAGQRPRETTPPQPASPSHPLGDGARPRRAGAAAATGGAGRRRGGRWEV